MDFSLLGSSVQGIFQTIILEWVAILFSGGIFLIHISSIAGRSFTGWATKGAPTNTLLVSYLSGEKPEMRYSLNKTTLMEWLIV